MSVIIKSVLSIIRDWLYIFNLKKVYLKLSQGILFIQSLQAQNIEKLGLSG